MLTEAGITGTSPLGSGPVAVVGGGLMGHGIAAVFAAAGLEVTCVEADPSARDGLVFRTGRALESMGADRALARRVHPVDRVEAIPRGTQYVTEAVPEVLDLKQQVFADLDRQLPQAVLATNTSVFRVGDVAARVTRPERVIGTHWWNPPHMIPLVEVVQAETTAEEAVASTVDLMAHLGKTPVRVRRDVPGFVGNRLQHAMWREAMALVDEGICDADTVDLVVKNSFGLRLSVLGPLENADYVGLEMTRAIHEYVFPVLSRARAPIAVLDQLIAEGRTGAATGRGFSQWTPERAKLTENALHDRIRLLLDVRTDAQTTDRDPLPDA